MAGVGLLMRRLVPRQLDSRVFAPFGIVIDTRGRAAEAINAGTTRRFSDLASLDVRGPNRDPVVGIYVAQARAFPLRIAKLERHRQAAQVFLPLGTQRCVVVVAPGGEAPLWEEVQAFVTSAGQGISLHRGCWHHGLVALGDGDRFAVIEGGGYRDDTEEVAVAEAIELAAPPEPLTS